jgi:hypothetical protein
MQQMLFAAILAALLGCLATASMPLPWTHELTYDSNSAVMEGTDVQIAQYLLKRGAYLVEVNGKFDAVTQAGVTAFQKANVDTIQTYTLGVFGENTATALLKLYSADGYKDDGIPAGKISPQYLYKLHVPVHVNRSIETKATLFDAYNKVLHTFVVRAHGHRDNDVGTLPWPDFGDGDIGLSQFAGSGDTTTGLIEVDLNTAEPDPVLYGPWPINRLVRGLEGNAKFLLPNIRDGQLLHTGNWSTDATGPWLPSMPMPNSSGCLHAHPEDIQRVYQLLLGLGVQVRQNPFSGKNYPYSPQGLCSIELVGM